MSTVEVRTIRKKFGSLEVIHGIDVGIDDGEFVVLVGPSGCGNPGICRHSPGGSIIKRESQKAHALPL